MLQFTLENAISFSIGLAFVVPTLIFGVFFLVRASIRPDEERNKLLAFGLALLSFAGAHIIWNIRAAIFPYNAQPTLWFPYWQGFWVFFITGITFLGLWSLLLAYPNLLRTRKWPILVLLIPWFIATIDVLLVSTPVSVFLVCSARIWDARPDLLVLLTTALPLTFYIGIAIDYLYSQFKAGADRLLLILIFIGLMFILVGGILDTKAIPDCPIITMGRMLMLGGFLLSSFSFLRFASKPLPE